MATKEEEIRKTLQKMRVVLRGVEHYLESLKIEGESIEFDIKESLSLFDNLSEIGKHKMYEPHRISKIKFDSICAKRDIEKMWNTKNDSVYDKVFKCIDTIRILNKIIDEGEDLFDE